MSYCYIYELEIDVYWYSKGLPQTLCGNRGVDIIHECRKITPSRVATTVMTRRLLGLHYLLEFIQWVGTFFLSLISQQGMWSLVNSGNSEWKLCFENPLTFSFLLQPINWDDCFYGEDSKQHQVKFPFLHMNSRKKVEISCLRVWRLSGICIIAENKLTP